MTNLTSSPEKLKASILQKAIQGKLTQQLPKDGNATYLVNKINNEKKQLIKDKKIKKQKNLLDITNEEIPFNIPSNWQWIRLNDITEIHSGLNYKRNNLSKNTDDVRIIRGGNISNNFELLLNDNDYRINKSFIKNENILLKENQLIMPVSTSPKQTGKVAIVPKLTQAVVAGGFIYQITPLILDYVISKFIMYALSCPKIKANILSITNLSGSALSNIPKTKLMNLVIPLPPLSEQKRIVDKLDSILPKVQKFNVLVNTLQKLRNDFPKRLKASLLKSAMQGKLTKQLPEDGNAMELLKQINDEKQQLIDDKKIKKHKALADITSEEIPFNIPDNWQWVRLRNISSYIQRGKSPKYGDDGIRVLSQKCVQWSGIDISKARRIRKESLKKYDKIRYLQNHDILWNSTGAGTLGRVSEILSDDINNDDILVVDSHVTIIRTLSNISHFVLMYLSSPYIQNNLNQLSSGSTKQIELSKKSIENVVIPLPPLEEQKRIVNKLDHLFKVLNLD